MAKHDACKIVFPSLGITCRAEKIPGVNEEVFDWFVDCMPIPEVVWSHAMVSGGLTYAMNLRMKYDLPCNLESLEKGWLHEIPDGYFTLFLSNGKAGQFMMKYTDITENMAYPIVGRVIEEDLPKLREVAKALWDADYLTKDPVTIAFEA